MELDVCLTRSGDEPWGFRLIGGVDFNMPLTVVKVLPSSPANAAGLQNGDNVFSIDGVDASVMTHEDSKKTLAAAGERLRLGVVRGLYDPVLDDYEPIYEPIDQEDFDQPSQPTEVPDYLDLTHTLPEFANTAPNGTNGVFKPLPDLVNGQKADRSLNESPFVLPTKPFRPFSTEPLPEIPPLEAPIILNPNFQDEFGRLKDEEEFLPKTRFKLPISEQYDPDGTKQKMKLEALRAKDVTTKDLTTTITESKTVKEETMVKKDIEMKEQAMTKQEVKFMEQVNKDIDLKSIELTATSIVDDSIEKAVTVAEEIQREIEVVLSESSDSESTQLKSSKESKASEVSSISQEESSKIDLKEKSVKEVTELVNLLDKTTEEIVKHSEQKEKKTVSYVNEAESIVDSKDSKRKISKTEKVVSDEVESKVSITKEDIKETQSLDQKDVQRKISAQESSAETIDLKESQTKTSKTQMQSDTNDSKSETKYTTSKLLAEQRAYTIGLQTIPNIRGTVHSSYHYDLLLKTFFIHLTDVMVALSRFILAEQVLSKPPEQETKTDVTERRETREETISKRRETASVDSRVKDIKTTAKVDTVSKEDVVQEKVCETAVTTAKIVPPEKKERVVGKILQKAHEIKQQEEQKTSKVEEKKKSVVHEQKRESEVKYVDDNIRTEEIVKRRELSGSRMAQLTEKKPEELMQNMENVLTEFESKSSNEDIEVVRERRSRSRSAVATPIDMLQQESYEHDVMTTSAMTTSAMSTSMTESKTSRTSESGYETTDYEKVDGAKTYVAIVQSHVYTNKDAIFEAISRESAEEIVTKEAVESVSSEKVKSLETSEKAVQAVVDTSSKIVSAEKESTEQVIKKSEQKSKEVIKEKQKKEAIVVKKDTQSVEKVQDVVIQEVIEPVVEEFKSTFTQDYTVTEAKEEIETSNTEFVSQRQQDVVIEEIATVKENTVTLDEKALSVAKEVVTEIKDKTVASEEAVSLKKESISAAITDVKKVDAITVQEVLAAESVKEERVAVKEEIAAIKEEAIVAKEQAKVEVAAVKESVAKEEVSEVKEEAVEDFKSVKQESVSIKHVTVKNEDESAALKISKEQIIEKGKSFIQVEEQDDVSLKKVEISEFENRSKIEHVENESYVSKIDQESSFVAKLIDQESTFVAKSNHQESTFVAKSIDHESSFVAKSIDQESTFVAKSIDQESTFVAKSIDQKSSFVANSMQQEVVTKVDNRENLKLALDSTYDQKKIQAEIYEEGDLSQTPTPCTVPPTPLTDEYVFSLTTKLPKREGPPIPRDCTPSDDEDEDPHIVKKGLVPIVEAKIEKQMIFDPPLPSPPTSPQSPTSPKTLGLKGGAPMSSRTPVYFKPGLRGGAPINTSSYKKTPVYIKPGLRGGAPIFPLYTSSPKTPCYVKPGLKGGADHEPDQEEIKEIELKSSLLASAIDETIKSIEEYKEEVGIKQILTEAKKEETVENGVMYNGYAKVVETKIFDSAVLEESSKQESKSVKEIKFVEETNTAQVNNIKEEKQVLTNGICENIETSNQKLESQTELVQSNNVPIVSAFESTAKPIETSTVEIKQEIIENTETKVENKPAVEEKKHVVIVEEKRDPMEGYRPVPFDPEELNVQRDKRAAMGIKIPYLTPSQERELYKTPTGEIIGTHKGIVDGLDEAVVDADAAKELGKPGITEEKIAELISGEAEMLREAHVMGLSRVLASHMQKDGDDSSIDFKKIKPIVESLKDSEVLKALNEELLRDAEERKKKEAQKKETWTTFLQKPKRPVPKSKFGYYKDLEPEEEKVPAYRPKIVKQPKPKVAPDYKPKDFNTGLLPWEERALREPTPPPVEPEDPILIPEEAPEILEAVDPLPESEVPDLEDSGIPLPPPPEPKEATPPPEEAPAEDLEELDLEAVVEETEKIVEEKLVEEMEGGNIAEQIMCSVQNMVDPNAPLEQQLAQMRAQLAALAQLPGVIQQSLELVTRQLSMLSQVDSAQKQQAIEEMPAPDMTPAAVEETEVSEDGKTTIEEIQNEEAAPQPEQVEPSAPTLTPEEIERMRIEEEQMLEEQRKIEKQKKELMEQARLESESRQIKQRPTPRVGNPLPDPRVGTPQPGQRNGKPQPVFGPAAPWERPVVLPGGRKWRTPKDAYNEAFIAETLQAQAELIAGKAMGVNFMKYEKPPVSLDHLKDSDVYKMVHNMDKTQPKRVEMLTPVIAEADYREKGLKDHVRRHVGDLPYSCRLCSKAFTQKSRLTRHLATHNKKCRSMTPCPQRLAQQIQP